MYIGIPYLVFPDDEITGEAKYSPAPGEADTSRAQCRRDSFLFLKPEFFSYYQVKGETAPLTCAAKSFSMTSQGEAVNRYPSNPLRGFYKPTGVTYQLISQSSST